MTMMMGGIDVPDNASRECDARSQEPEKPQKSHGSESTDQSKEERGGEGGVESGSVVEQGSQGDSLREHKGREGRLRWWKKFREGQKSDWWFASTGIPLLAATLGPLANVTSIAALVTSWRQTVYLDGEFVSDFDGVLFGDPTWCYWLNVASLICGFLGNLFLLLNFTQRIRYLIALPATIIFWYLSTGFLIGITVCMDMYTPPNRPYETYTQGFWYAISAAAFYLICSMILMVNMLGYFLGHYPDHFALSDAQRTLILQTMVFFIWLGGGAAVFSRIETDIGSADWSFSDALYFCDVTILTVGFGDLYPTTDIGRGLVFPYSVGGMITLSLIVSSIYKFMRQLGEENIVQRRIDRMRKQALECTVTNSFDLRRREHEAHHLLRRRTVQSRPKISAPKEGRPYRTAIGNTVRRVTSLKPSLPRPLARKPRLLLLREEKDRFNTMRKIQHQTAKFKKWYALIFSTIAFGILWCVGAVVFWQAEKDAQGMTYFQALYFCYVSLLTIGYGDLSPKSNAGRTFFVVWSLIAVPTMTILVSDMGDTVVDKFKTWSSGLADFTVLPKEGIWRAFLEQHPWLLDWVQRRVARRAAKKRIQHGFDTLDPNAEPAVLDAPDTVVVDGDVEGGEEGGVAHEEPVPSLAVDVLQGLPTPITHASLSRRLAKAIQLVAKDMRLARPKAYSYEEWVEFTQLIRYSRHHVPEEVLEEEDAKGLVEWDWLGENSPLIAGMSESEWLVERLTASLIRVQGWREGFCERQDWAAVESVESGMCARVIERDEDENRKKDGGKEDADGTGANVGVKVEKG